MFSRLKIVHETDPGTDTMMKICLPLFFIVFKITGTFIDFMLGLSKTNANENDTYPGKGLVTWLIKFLKSYNCRQTIGLVLKF